MNWWRRLRKSVELEDRLDAELRFHFDRVVDEHIHKGMPIAEARRAARLEFGGLDQIKEECRDARGTLWVESVWRDIRLASRMLRKSPGFALAVIGTLALGIGANTAIFSAVYAILLKPLPFSRPAELVNVSICIPEIAARFPSLPFTGWLFEEFRRTSTSVAGMAALKGMDFDLTGGGEPERVHGARVSANFFDLLGVAPARGRAFSTDEDVPGRDGVVVISHDLWMHRFGGDSTVLNRTVQLNGNSVQVVGILPEGFLAPTGRQLDPVVLGPRIDIWKPMAFTKEERENYQNWQYAVVARLQPGGSIARSRDEMNSILNGISRRFRGKDSDALAQLRPIREVFCGDVRQGLAVLFGAVALLLLIGCVNLANLMLARMSSRDREFATRAALGAPRARLVQQIVIESLMISSLGGVSSLLVAWSGSRLLISLAPAQLMAMRTLSLNAPVLLFAMAASLAAAVAFGLAPAFDAARRTLPERTAGLNSRTSRTRRMLVTVEVALCTGLLAVAGLLLHSFVKVMNVDKGFTVERILSADIHLPEKLYTPAQASAFYSQLLERIRALPGVLAAGAVTGLPLEPTGYTNGVTPESDTKGATDGAAPACNDVTPGYFETMGIALLSGRFFAQSEPSQAVIASETLARKLWPGQPVPRAVGRRIRMGGREGVLYTIVGVVGDVRTVALDTAPLPALYLPHSQEPERSMSVVLRTAIDPRTLGPAIRSEVRKLDRNLPVSAMRTMREVVSASVAQRRFELVLVTLFGVLAALLAVVGIYAVTSYSIARQTQEIGLRMALGAQSSEVLQTILLRGLRPILAGLAIGMVVARLGATAIRGFLFGVGPLDPMALGGVATILLLAGGLACYLPARRASLLDPVTALRLE